MSVCTGRPSEVGHCSLAISHNLNPFPRAYREGKKVGRHCGTLGWSPEAAPIKCAGRESAGLPTLSVGEFVSLSALSI